jgi:hypothetical protein
MAADSIYQNGWKSMAQTHGAGIDAGYASSAVPAYADS